MTTNENIDESKKIQKDLMWGLYQEYRNHARHSETIRSNLNNYMLVISSALITIITFDNNINFSDFPLALIVCFIGFISLLFSASYSERYARNRERSEEVLTELDKLFFKNALNLRKMKTDADKKHYQNSIFSLIHKLTKSSYLFWLLLPLIVFIVGGILIIFSLQGK